MTIAIEPMIKIAGAAIRTLDDNWTVVTQDGSLLAQFEDTVAIGENGDPRIVTTQLSSSASLTGHCSGGVAARRWDP